MKAIFGLSVLAIWFALFWGCILNLFDLATGYATMATNELALRGIGIVVAPLGAHFGWF